MSNLRRGFTLLEVLVAGGILFIVSAAVVGLSNSIIQGTAVTNDVTITNRLAAEGLELATKIRDDRSKGVGFTGGANRGEAVWVDRVNDTDNYGWHYLRTTDGISWTLNPVASDYKNIIPLTDDTVNPLIIGSDRPIADTLQTNRLICIESIAAARGASSNNLHCNTNGSDTNTKIYEDGQRIGNSSDCYNEASTADRIRTDLYCRLTKPSLNREGAADTEIIRDGNAVKVRSAVLWNDRGKYQRVDIATLLTNWRSVSDL